MSLPPVTPMMVRSQCSPLTFSLPVHSLLREKREAEQLKREQELQAKAKAEAEAKAKRREAELQKQKEARERKDAERRAKEAERARKEEEKRNRLEEEQAREAERERARKEKEEQARREREAAKEAKEKERHAREERERQRAVDLTGPKQPEDARRVQEEKNRQPSVSTDRQASKGQRSTSQPTTTSATHRSSQSVTPGPVAPTTEFGTPSGTRGQTSGTHVQSPPHSVPVTPSRPGQAARSGSIGFGLPPRPAASAMGPPPGMTLPMTTGSIPRGPVSPGRPRNAGVNSGMPASRSTSVSSGTGTRASAGAIGVGLATPSTSVSPVPRTAPVGSIGSLASLGPGVGGIGLGMPSFGSFSPLDPRPAPGAGLFNPAPTGLSPGAPGAGSLDPNWSVGLGGPPTPHVANSIGIDSAASALPTLGGNMPPSLGTESLLRVPSVMANQTPATRPIQRPSVAPIGDHGAIGPIRPPRHVSDGTKPSHPPASPEHILGSSALLSGSDEPVEPVGRRPTHQAPAAPTGAPGPQGLAPAASTNGSLGMGFTPPSPWESRGSAASGQGESLLGSLGGTPIGPPGRSRSTTTTSPASMFHPGFIGTNPAPGAPHLGGVGSTVGMDDWPPRPRVSTSGIQSPWDSTRMAFEHAPGGLPPGLEDLNQSQLFGFPGLSTSLNGVGNELSPPPLGPPGLGPVGGKPYPLPMGLNLPSGLTGLPPHSQPGLADAWSWDPSRAE